MNSTAISLLIVFCLSVPWCMAQQRNTKAHRVIPREGGGQQVSFRDIAPQDLLRTLRAIQEPGQRGAGSASPRVRPMLPQDSSNLPADAAEVVRTWSESVGRSMVEAINTDIAEFTKEMQERFEQQAGDPSSRTRVPEMEIPELSFDAEADVNRNLMELLKEAQKYQNEVNRLAKEYRKSWPSESIPPREWIQKVQPFINQELVNQFREAMRELEQNQVGRDSPIGPRPSERQSSSYDSVPESKPNRHSNPVVGSVLKALDARGTTLIKSATSRPQSRGQSWWKSLKARSRHKLRALNRRFTDNSRAVANHRNQLQSLSWNSGNAPSLSVAKPILASLALIVLAGTGVWFARRWSSRRKWYPRIEAARLDPRSIRDSRSLIQSVHALGGQLYGLPSHFWHHRRFFAELRASTALDPVSTDVLTGLYERARYASHHAMSEEDLTTARQLFGTILQRSMTSS